MKRIDYIFLACLVIGGFVGLIMLSTVVGFLCAAMRESFVAGFRLYLEMTR